MKIGLSVEKIFVLLIFLFGVSAVEAQKKKPNKIVKPPELVMKESAAKIAEIRDFAFVVEIDKAANVTVKIQKTEDSEILANASSNENLTNFFSAFSRLPNDKNSLAPIIVLKADGSLNFGDVVKVIQSLRVSPKQKIKLQISKDFYAAIPPLIDENNLREKPNPLFLLVELRGDSKITLNNEEFGSFENILPLKEKLAQVFKEREEYGVFREGSNEVEKTVFIKAPLPVKFSDVIKLVQEVEKSGAVPIALQIDENSVPEVPAPPRQ